MGNETGEFTAAELAAMDTRDVVALIRRNSGDENFYWRVREAVLNRAADEIERLSTVKNSRENDEPGTWGFYCTRCKKRASDCECAPDNGPGSTP